MADVDLQPGTRQVLTARLDLPADLHGLPLESEELKVRADGIFPVRLSIEDTTLIDEGLPMVAAGPAQVQALPQVRVGDNGEVRLAIHRPLSQGQGRAWSNWIGVQFTTPGLVQRFEQLDLAWARLRLAAEFATTDVERMAVAEAAALVPAEALPLSSTELPEVLDRVATALTPVVDRIADVRVHIIGHCHIDLAWLWTWEETREVIKRDMRSVLAMMQDYPEMTFTHSQPAGYEVIRREEPE